MAIRPFNAFHQYTKTRPENQSQPNPHQPPKPAPGPAEVFDLAAKAVQAGYRVTQAELQERTGYALEPAQGAGPGGLEEWRLGGLASPLRGAGPTAPQSPWSVGQSPTLNRRPSVSPSGPRRPSGPSPEPAADSPGGLAALAEALQADCAPLTHALQTLLDQAQQPEGTGRGAEPHPETTHDSRFAIHDLRREAAALAARLPELLPEDPELAAQIRTLLDGTFDEAKLAVDTKANAARARSVVTHLMAKRGGSEPKALYRQDTGWVGIDYGEPGNKDNAFAGGHGLAHILAKHPKAKDTLVDTLQKGEAYKHPQSASKPMLIHGNTVVVLTKRRDDRLLITDYVDVPRPANRQLQEGRPLPCQRRELKERGRHPHGYRPIKGKGPGLTILRGFPLSSFPTSRFRDTY